MGKSISQILEMIQQNNIEMVDFKMVDINGQYRHVTIPARNFSEETMTSGIGFDASNYGYARGGERRTAEGDLFSGGGRPYDAAGGGVERQRPHTGLHSRAGGRDPSDRQHTY